MPHPRRFSVVSVIAIACVVVLFVASCGADDPAADVVADSSESSEESSDDAAQVGADSESGGDGEGVDDPGSEIDEVQARNTLTVFIDALANDDYPTAAGYLVGETISSDVLSQLAIAADEATEPGRLEDALADYCRATNCQASYQIGDVATPEPAVAVFFVTADGPDLVPIESQIPVGVADGRYTVGLLPFGSPEILDSDVAMPEGDVPFYPGEDSGQGWRAAPVAERDPLVLVWRPTEVLRPAHTGQYGSVATGQFAAVVDVGSGIAYQSERPYDSADADDTIWLQTGQTAALVESAADEYVTLEGSRVLDIDEAVVYYQVRSGSMPEDTKSRLYQVNTLSGQVDEIAVVGGWESGVDFYDFSAGYPQVGGAWGAEGYVGVVVLDLSTGATVYDSDISGVSCFDGQPDCPWYEVLTYNGEVVHGIRPFHGPNDVVIARSLFRFDPDSGVETEIARFGWDNGLWYPRNIMLIGDEVIVSLEDGSGSPLPAVIVDVTSGQAATHSLAGFVGPTSLS